MAKKVITSTEFIDDLDGSVAAGTVAFSFDGANFEIDLSKKNKTAMEKALKPYLDHARKTRAARGRRTSSSAATRRTDLATVRAWAHEHGLQVSDRGRISKAVLEQYNAAH